MNFEISCPHCDTRLQVASDWSGQRMSCSACNGQFVVPALQAPAAAAPAARGRGPAKARGRTAGGGGTRAAAGSRSGSGDHGSGEPRLAQRTAHVPRTSPWVHVMLVVGVLGALAALFTYTARHDSGAIFRPEEAPPRVWTYPEVEGIVRGYTEAEKRYRNSVANLWRANLTTRDGEKLERECRESKEKMFEYLYKEVLVTCEKFDPVMARQIVDKVTKEWEAAEEGEQQRNGVARGSGTAPPPTLVPDGEGGVTPVPADPTSAIEKEDRRLDKVARAEIQELLQDKEVPEAYSDRARWLSAELVVLRDEARSAGYNLNGFAFRVARVEELWKFFDSWAKPTERSQQSFKWGSETLRSLQVLRDQWRGWSSGKNKNLDQSRVSEALTDLVEKLEKAESIFN